MLYDELSRQFPKSPEWLDGLARCDYMHAGLLGQHGRFADAEPLLTQALESRRAAQLGDIQLGELLQAGVKVSLSTDHIASISCDPFASMRIGPGMAPQAKLYAFRVFGCEGTTNLVADAIDMAADPNGDGDPGKSGIRKGIA